MVAFCEGLLEPRKEQTRFLRGVVLAGSDSQAVNLYYHQYKLVNSTEVSQTFYRLLDRRI